MGYRRVLDGKTVRRDIKLRSREMTADVKQLRRGEEGVRQAEGAFEVFRLLLPDHQSERCVLRWDTGFVRGVFLHGDLVELPPPPAASARSVDQPHSPVAQCSPDLATSQADHSSLRPSRNASPLYGLEPRASDPGLHQNLSQRTIANASQSHRSSARASRTLKKRSAERPG
jgi:hypothetical protein